MKHVNRRRVLKGMLDGTAVTLALPLLNLFLNGNGNALANGEQIPLRFGTWIWGLGMNDVIFTPKKTGANFDLPEEIASLAPVQKHINLFTNYHVFKDAAPNLCHHTGWVILRSGIAPLTASRASASVRSGKGSRSGNTLPVSSSSRLTRVEPTWPVWNMKCKGSRVPAAAAALSRKARTGVQAPRVAGVSMRSSRKLAARNDASSIPICSTRPRAKSSLNGYSIPTGCRVSGCPVIGVDCPGIRITENQAPRQKKRRPLSGPPPSFNSS